VSQICGRKTFSQKANVPDLRQKQNQLFWQSAFFEGGDPLFLSPSKILGEMRILLIINYNK
jgi:hypothetical protein